MFSVQGGLSVSDFDKSRINVMLLLQFLSPRWHAQLWQRSVEFVELLSAEQFQNKIEKWPVKFLKLKFINFKIYRFLYVFSNIFIEKFEIQYPVVFSYSNSKFYIYVKNVLKIVLLIGS